MRESLYQCQLVEPLDDNLQQLYSIHPNNLFRIRLVLPGDILLHPVHDGLHDRELNVQGLMVGEQGEEVLEEGLGVLVGFDGEDGLLSFLLVGFGEGGLEGVKDVGEGGGKRHYYVL